MVCQQEIAECFAAYSHWARTKHPAKAEAARRRPTEMPLNESDLPASPGPREIVRKRHADQDEESEDSGANGELREFGTVFHMHEEQDHKHRLGAGDTERDDGVEHTHVHK